MTVNSLVSTHPMKQARKTAPKTHDTAYRPGIGRLLLLARENFFQRVEKVTKHLFDATTLRTCSPIVAFIDERGIRSIDLSRRLAVSKQAIGPKINALVDRGFAECVGDPEDRRAFLVLLTPAGRKFRNDIAEAILRVERDLENEVGLSKVGAMREVLTYMASEQLDDIYASMVPSEQSTRQPPVKPNRPRYVPVPSRKLG